MPPPNYRRGAAGSMPGSLDRLREDAGRAEGRAVQRARVEDGYEPSGRMASPDDVAAFEQMRAELAAEAMRAERGGGQPNRELAHPGQSDEDYAFMLRERSKNDAEAAQHEQYSPEAADISLQRPKQYGEMLIEKNGKPGYGSLGPHRANQGEAAGAQPDRGYLAKLRDAIEVLDVMLSRDMGAPNEGFRPVSSGDGEPTWEEMKAAPQPEWSPDVPALAKPSAPGEPTWEEMFAPAKSKYEFKERVPRKKETF